MHEDYNDENEYDDDDYDYDHPSINPYNADFKFDVSADHPISKWLDDIINQIDWSLPLNIVPGFPFVSLPVNSWNPNAGKGNSFQYLGSNYQGAQIWKNKYFVLDPIDIEYRSHLQNHAKHFVNQPTYYKGLFDILN